MSDDIYTIQPENLVIVLSEFFKSFNCNPLQYVPMDEAVTIWNQDHPANEEGAYEVLESDLFKFMDKINGLQVDRVMLDMDAKGLATLGHDGKDFVLMRKDA